MKNQSHIKEKVLHKDNEKILQNNCHNISQCEINERHKGDEIQGEHLKELFMRIPIKIRQQKSCKRQIRLIFFFL